MGLGFRVLGFRVSGSRFLQVASEGGMGHTQNPH